MQAIGIDRHGAWLYAPTGARWAAPHAEGVFPFEVVVLLAAHRPFVTWWVDDPSDARVEIDVSLPPYRTDDGWTFIDLELDPIRHEDGTVEVEDRDEFEEACREGHIGPVEAAEALETAALMERTLREYVEPWGKEGWLRLHAARRDEV